MKLLSKLSFLLAAILLGGLAFSGCVGGGAAQGAVARGWSGGTIAGDILFIGSMKGELVAINISDGSRLWAETLKGETSGGGFLGCAPASTTVAIYGSPSVAGGLVFVGGYNGKIYAINIVTRLSKDKYLNVNGRDHEPIVGSPLVAGDSIYIGSSDKWFYSLKVVGLDENWKFETGGKIWSTPAIDGDTLYIGSFDKKLYALNIADGSKKWEFATGGAIVATPLVDNGTVYIGSFDRYLYAVNASDGSLKWKFPAGNPAGNWFWAKPVVHNGTIYAASLDGKVYAIDARSGDKLVEFDLGSPVSSSPVVVGNLIIVAREDGAVYAIDTSTNQEKWKNYELKEKKQMVYASLAANQRTVYIHTSQDVLYALNAQSGAELWPPLSLKSTPPPSTSTPPPSGGTNWGLIIGITVVGMVLAMVFRLLARRRKV